MSCNSCENNCVQTLNVVQSSFTTAIEDKDGNTTVPNINGNIEIACGLYVNGSSQIEIDQANYKQFSVVNRFADTVSDPDPIGTMYEFDLVIDNTASCRDLLGMVQTQWNLAYTADTPNPFLLRYTEGLLVNGVLDPATASILHPGGSGGRGYEVTYNTGTGVEAIGTSKDLTAPAIFKPILVPAGTSTTVTLQVLKQDQIFTTGALTQRIQSTQVSFNGHHL